MEASAFLAIGIQSMVHNEPKHFAKVVAISHGENLMSVLEREAWVDTIMYANVFKTRKQAQATADSWNEAYKINGTYFF